MAAARRARGDRRRRLRWQGARDAGDDAGLQRHDAREGGVRRPRHQGHGRHRSHRSRPAALEGRAQDEGGFRPLRPAKHVGPQRLHAGFRGLLRSMLSGVGQAVHCQQRLAHSSRPEPRDRDAGQRDRVRGRRSGLYAACVLGERDERFRRHRRRDVHIIRDESGAVAKTVVVQFIPKDATRRIDVVPAPGNCPF
jgi:hypothetical protein